MGLYATRMRITRLIQEGDGRCQYCRQRCCGEPPQSSCPTLDHDVPKSRGGTRNGGNAVLACWGCNGVKVDMTGVEFRHFLATGELHRNISLTSRKWRKNGQSSYLSPSELTLALF